MSPEPIHGIEPLLTIKDVTQILGVHDRTVRGWINQGKIPYLRIGGAIRFQPSDIRRWFESRKVSAIAGSRHRGVGSAPSDAPRTRRTARRSKHG